MGLKPRDEEEFATLGPDGLREESREAGRIAKKMLLHCGIVYISPSDGGISQLNQTPTLESSHPYRKNPSRAPKRPLRPHTPQIAQSKLTNDETQSPFQCSKPLR